MKKKTEKPNSTYAKSEKMTIDEKKVLSITNKYIVATVIASIF